MTIASGAARAQRNLCTASAPHDRRFAGVFSEPELTPRVGRF